MGFFDFLKKTYPKEKETISYLDIPNWIINKKNELNEKEKNFKLLILENLNQTIKELKESILIFEDFNLSNKKAEERIKFIVRENLATYLNFLKRLIKNLEEINFELGLIEIMEKIDILFADFNQKSFASYEKATYLIGDELGKTKKIISDFLTRLNKKLKEEKDFIETIKIISLVEKLIYEINEIEGIKKETEKNIFLCEKKLKELIEKENSIKSSIDKLKNSEGFKLEISKNNEIRKKAEILEKEIYSLKEMIDFKKLASIYHKSPEKMSELKYYRENFKDSFIGENFEKIKQMIIEAKLDSSNILNKFQEIYFIKKEVENSSYISIEGRQIRTLESDLRKLNIEISNINEDIIKEKRKFQRFIENIESIKKSIVEKMEKIGILIK